MQYQNVLLASHGTEGAQAAERLALSLCAPGATLHHLLVVPELWQGMMGDDWLNNVRTRITFGNHLENEISKELEEHMARVGQSAEAQGVQYQPEVRQGDPAECLAEFSHLVDHEVVVIGAPRPKGREGLRSRLQVEKVTRQLNAPLLVVPFPNA